MLKIIDLINDMEAILQVCPPYVSPGTTSWKQIMAGSGCDCSGVFTAIFKRYGEDMYHGSNTMARQYTYDLEPLTSDKQLSAGDVVYKWSESGEPSKYASDGLGNFQHVGLVTSTKPLRIVHQSSASGHTACDTKLGKWKYRGRLDGVDYDAHDDPLPVVPSGGDDVVLYQAKVKTSGVTLNVRANGSTSAKVVGKLKNGSIVNVHETSRDWCRISQNGLEGWSNAAYLVPIKGTESIDQVVTQVEQTEDVQLTPEQSFLVRLCQQLRAAGIDVDVPNFKNGEN